MADTKISALPSATPTAATAILPFVPSGGSTSQATLAVHVAQALSGAVALHNAGTGAAPGMAYVDEAALGWSRVGAGLSSHCYSGAERWRFSAANLYAQVATEFGQSLTNAVFTIVGRVSTAATASVQFSQVSSLAFSATSGSQRGLGIGYTVNQASGTAGFAALRIATTETALGSGQQSMIECYGGAAGTTAVFRVSNVGVITALGSMAYTPALGTDWVDADPATITAAIDRIARHIVSGGGAAAIA